MIFFNNLTFTYPGSDQPAVRNINLDIKEGSFTLLIGASGSGKSTLLRCVNGLVPHFSGGILSGEITVNGLNPVIASPKVISRHVGFVFQDPESQFIVDRVEDEIAFTLENIAMQPEAMQAKVDEILELLDLKKPEIASSIPYPGANNSAWLSGPPFHWNRQSSCWMNPPLSWTLYLPRKYFWH